MLKRRSKLIVSAIIIVLFLGFAFIFSLTDTDLLYSKFGLRDKNLPAYGIMYVNCIDVGQGSATLITCGDTTILVDGGEEAYSSKLINYIKNQNIKHIDCIIATHQHSDHIGALPDVLEEFDVTEVIVPNVPENDLPNDDCYNDFMNAVRGNVELLTKTKGGSDYSYGQLNVEIFSPLYTYKDFNNYSIIARISFKNNSVIVTGDAQAKSEEDVMNSFDSINSDILCVAHHGSNSSTSDEWLDAVNPQFAVISCGVNNDYNHPNSDLVNRLESHKIKYYRTDLDGDTVFRCDGETVNKIN